jgi:hypothetical protein
VGTAETLAKAWYKRMRRVSTLISNYLNIQSLISLLHVVHGVEFCEADMEGMRTWKLIMSISMIIVSGEVLAALKSQLPFCCNLRISSSRPHTGNVC